METAKNVSKLNQFLDRLDRYFKVTGWIAGGLAFVMMFALVREVGGRYFFNSPTDWAIDINAFLFVVMVYLGSAYTTTVDGHVRADFIYGQFKGKTLAIVDIIISAICIAYAVVLIWQGGSMAWESFRSAEVSSGGIRVPLFPFQILIPIGSFLVFLCFLSKIFRSLLVLLKGGEA